MMVMVVVMTMMIISKATYVSSDCEMVLLEGFALLVGTTQAPTEQSWSVFVLNTNTFVV